MGSQRLALAAKLFRWWRRIDAGTLTRAAFVARVERLEGAVRQQLELGKVVGTKATRGTCRHILAREAALSTFVRVEGVEPTHNAAERALRHLVLWRKTSFGTHSSAGSRFVERMMSIVTSLRCQCRSVIAFLRDAVQAWLGVGKPPSLVPNA